MMVDVEHWWPRSNPDHIVLELLDRGPLALGSRLRIRERVAGIPADATRSITEFDEGARVTWKSAATYRLLGVPLTGQVGVTWTSESDSATVTTISARVWAVLPSDRLSTALFRTVGGVKKNSAHTRTESCVSQMTPRGGGGQVATVHAPCSVFQRLSSFSVHCPTNRATVKACAATPTLEVATMSTPTP